MKIKKFVKRLKHDCKTKGVKFNLQHVKRIKYPSTVDMKVSGYFDGEIPELACATKKKKKAWVQILIHESCHMDQWSSNSPLWLKLDENNGYDLLDEWLGGKKFKKKVIAGIIEDMLALELDCEKRSVKKIKKNKLNIDCKQYIKEANTYMYFYPIMLKTGKWCDIAPYTVKELVELMPDKFLDIDEYFQFSKKLLNLYKKHCFKK